MKFKIGDVVFCILSTRDFPSPSGSALVLERGIYKVSDYSKGVDGTVYLNLDNSHAGWSAKRFILVSELTNIENELYGLP